MIPAVLSCIFVLYLYRTLNAPDASDDSPSAADSTPDEFGGLVRRLTTLQQQLDNLSGNESRGGDV